MRIYHWDLRKEMINHAKDTHPKECCGFIITNKTRSRYGYLRCKNIASSNNQFVIDPKSYIKLKPSEDIFAIIHSHNMESLSGAFIQPSQLDLQQAKASGLPWIICSTTGHIETIQPIHGTPLYGRPWVYRVWDCWTLVEDIYKANNWGTINWQTLIPQSIRNVDHNLFEREFVKHGWKEVRDWKDTTQAVKPNSLCPGDIYVNGGHTGVVLPNGQLATHLFSRLSEPINYSKRWYHPSVKFYRKTN